MNFFERQAEMRRLSRLLVVLFTLAVLAVVAAVDLAVLAAACLTEGAFDPEPGAGFFAGRGRLLALTSLIVLALIALAGLYRTMTLSEGGGAVAMALGGARVSADTRDPSLRRLLNVVEEMAIASGVPMPEVYLLEHESGINAFAAGHQPSDAAIAVTRGALDNLSRAELQGVIAHEFSHILNGDMRLNVRLIGLLFGLLVLALVARTVLRWAPRGLRGRRGNGALIVILLVALATWIAGSIGLFFGRIIQAAISRSRESLADAAAVQFTRDPLGLRGALVKIGALPVGSRLITPEVEEVAHMLFAPGARRLLATHPPLEKRLRALDPQFDPSEFARVRAELARAERSDQAAGVSSSRERRKKPAAAALPSTAGLPQAVVSLVGNPGTDQVQAAHDIRSSLPVALDELTAHPASARAILFALIIDAGANGGDQLLEQIRQRLGESVVDEISTVLPIVSMLRPEQRLPTLTLAFPALRQLTRESRQRMLDCLRALMASRRDASVRFYALLKLAEVWLRDDLDPRVPAQRLTLQSVALHLQVLFSILARHGHDSRVSAQQAYEAGMSRLLPLHRPEFSVGPNWPLQLDVALTQLDRLEPAGKELLIEAMVRTVTHDQTLTIDEAELLRAVCAALHCPLPPLIAEQPSDGHTVETRPAAETSL